MSAIGPGDWVEALRDEISIDKVVDRIVVCRIFKGRIYRVISVLDDLDDCIECGDDRPGIFLNTDDPLSDGAWCPCVFRLIYRPKADLFESLKTMVSI